MTTNRSPSPSPPRSATMRERRAKALALVAAAAASVLLPTSLTDGGYASFGLQRGADVSRGLGATSSSSSSSSSSPAAGTAPRRTTGGSAKPSHVTLCEEYLSRSAGPSSSSSSSAAAGPASFTVAEEAAVCADGDDAHGSVLGMFASSVVASAGSGLGLRYMYRRECGETADDHKGGDRTTLQQILPDMLIAEGDGEAVDAEALSAACRACVSDFKDTAADDYGGGAYHCLLIPESGSGGGEPILTRVLSSIKGKLNDAAREYLPRAASEFVDPAREALTGAVIFIDDTSTFMNYSVYDRVIPHYVDHVQIMASSSCKSASEGGESSCIEHAERLYRYFKQRQAEGAGVHYDVMGSTAASFARMVNAHRLVCPPNTTSCLLPALVKTIFTSTALADAPGEPDTASDWFGKITPFHGVVNVVIGKLTDEEADMPLSVIEAARAETSKMSLTAGASLVSSAGATQDTGVATIVADETPSESVDESEASSTAGAEKPSGKVTMSWVVEKDKGDR